MSGESQLAPGTVLKTASGNKIKIKKFLASGGQGEVYVVDYKGEDKALKWYFSKTLGKNPNAFYENIKNNAQKGSPHPAFLWPIEITEWKNDSFGYVMDLAPKGYYELSVFMCNTVKFASYIQRIDAALKIVSAFRVLHNQGYSYFDLNDGNFMINPDTGDVRIPDCDNVAPNGTTVGIKGKPAYMAPEVTADKTGPNTLSDLYSMAIILFLLFTYNHPLEGKRFLSPGLTDKQAAILYGDQASFIMDPSHPENTAVRGIHEGAIGFWNEAPGYIKKLFEKTFLERGNKNPQTRTIEIEWLKGLARFRSEIIPCSCGDVVFLSDDHKNCESCGKRYSFPYKFELSGYSVFARKGVRIYRCQLGACSEKKALDPIALVISKKDNPNVLGLKNLSKDRWYATAPNGNHKIVNPGEVAPLKEGIQLEIGDTTIAIQKGV